jgi:Concanavalin A-like lectin/glucanases superfamily/Fibronectin type III domain
MSIFRLRSHSRGLGLSPRRSRRAGAEPPGDTEAPSIPQNLGATAISDDQIDLTWDASTDNVAVAGYRIYRDNVLVDTSPTNSHSDTGLDPATEYEYEVSAIDAASNESARSAPDSATTHQVIVTAGLVAEWRFDDGAGQQITDYSGNGYHAQLGATDEPVAGEPTWSSTGVDCVLSATDNFITTSTSAGISGTDARTVIVVAQCDLSEVGFGFFQWVGDGGLTTRWQFHLRGTDANFLGWTINSGIGFETSLSPTTNTWHFLAVTQDDQGLDNGMTIYLDDAAESAPGFGISIDTAGDIVMGPLGESQTGILKKGKFAYALLYDRELSAGEIEQNRQALAAILAGRGIILP